MKRLVFLLFVLIASCVHGQSVYNLPGDTVKAKNMIVRGVLNGQLPYSNITGAPVIPAQFNPIQGTNIILTGVYPNITISASNSGGGLVTSVFGRQGIVVAASGDYSSFYYPLTGNPSGFLTAITSGQVIGALGYTPYNATNPSNFISGITSAMVTGALGYTPYNSTNPNSYISGINSSMVTTALGFTPYNVTNPSGYITLSSLANSAPITYNSGTGTIGISQATTSTNGYVSSTDWNTFNGKQAALGFTPYNSTNPNGYIALTAISATSPIFYNSATGVVSSQAATTSVNGYLTATDWNTFNGKQAAGSYALTTGTLGQFAATTSAQLAGVISDETGSGLVVFGTSPTFVTNITAPQITGSTSSGGNLTLLSTSNATKGKIVLGTASAFIESTNRLGIGTLSPGGPLHVVLNSTYDYFSGVGADPGFRVGLTFVRKDAAPASGTVLGSLQFNGTMDAYANGPYSGAEIQGVADGTWTNITSTPGRLDFYTTPSGSTTPVKNMSILSTGVLATGAQSIGGNMTPTTTNTFLLGSSSAVWNTVYTSQFNSGSQNSFTFRANGVSMMQAYNTAHISIGTTITDDGITSHNLQVYGSEAIVSTQTSVNGSTSGTAAFQQPISGGSLRIVTVNLASLVGTASYTFPVAFTNTPVVLSSSGLATSIVTSLSITAMTCTGATTSGTIIVMGY